MLHTITPREAKRIVKTARWATKQVYGRRYRPAEFLRGGPGGWSLEAFEPVALAGMTVRLDTSGKGTLDLWLEDNHGPAFGATISLRMGPDGLDVTSFGGQDLDLLRKRAEDRRIGPGFSKVDPRALQALEDYTNRALELAAEHLGVRFQPRIRFNRQAGRSYGGPTRVTYGMAGIAKVLRYPDAQHLFREYASISDDPEIGTFQGTGWEYLAALAAHEVAHGAAWLIQPYCTVPAVLGISHEDAQDRRPHGRLWRAVYRFLRTRLLQEVRAGARDPEAIAA